MKAPETMVPVIAVWRRFGGLGLILALGGCMGAGPFLYNEDRDKTAQQAQEAYQQANLIEVVETERTNLTGILDVELGVVQRHIDTVLEAEWFRLADSKQPLRISYLQQGIDKREAQLGTAGLDEEHRIDLALVDKTLELQGQRAEEAASFFKTELNQIPPPCNASPTRWEEAFQRIATAAESQGTLEFYSRLKDRYENACKADREAIRTVVERLPGESRVREAYEEWDGAREEYEALQDAFDQAVRDYEDAKARVDAAEEEGTESASDLPSEVQELSQKFHELVEKAGPLGESFVADKRIEGIDALLAAVSMSKADESALTTPMARQGASVVATLPALASEAYGVINSARAPRVAALLIEKERQSVNKAAAERRLARMERRVELLKAKFYALVLEVRLYQKIRVQNAILERAQPDLFDQTLSNALNTGNRDAKRALWLSLMHYVDSIATARAQQERLDYLLISLDHEEALDNSEMAIGMWNALIVTPINQLVAYHGAGIRREEVAALLIQLVTLGGIAVGVNR